MTVETQNNYVIYTGNGVTTQFPYAFRIPEMDMAQVFLLDAVTNSIIRQLNNGEFSITGVSINNYDGGEVTYPLTGTPITSAVKLLIQREAAYTQGLDLENQGGFYPESVEYQLDKLVFQIQQLARNVGRSLKTPLDVTLPEGHFVLVDGDGNMKDGGSGADIASAQAQAEAAIAARSGAEEAESGAIAAAAAISTAPQWAFASKAAAELFNPDAAPSFVSLSGGDFANALGRSELFEVLPAATPDPTDLPAPAFVRFVDGSLARWAGREFPLELGAKGDGTTDNSSFFEDLSGSMTAFDGVIVAERGVFKTNKSLVIPKAASFIGQGSDKTIITAASSTGTFDNNAVVSKVGSTPTRIADLSTSPGKGAYLLNFTSAHGLVAGNVILILDPRDYSYGGDPVAGTGWRPVYKAGEYCRVLKATSSTQIQLVGRIYSDSGYDKDHTEVYLVDGTATGILRGFNAIAPGPGANGVVNAVHAQHLCRLAIEDVWGSGSDNASVWIDHVFGCRISGHKASQTGAVDSSFGTYYGIVVSDCQHVDIGQSELSAYRHAVAVGGGNGTLSIVTRDVHVHHSRLRNELFTVIDWHGPSEWCRYSDLDIQGDYGLSLGGNHNRAVNINFDVQNMAVYGGELTGADHTIKGWCGRSVQPEVGSGVIDIGTSGASFADNGLGGQFKFRDLDIYSPLATGGAIQVRNRGYAGEWGVHASGIRYDAPSAINAGVVAVFGVSGSAASLIDVSNISGPSNSIPAVYTGGTDAASPVKGLSDEGIVSITTSTSNSTMTASVSFAKPFPKAPAVTISPDRHTTSSDTLGAYATSVTATGFTLVLARVDDLTQHFTAALVVKCSWTAKSY